MSINRKVIAVAGIAALTVSAFTKVSVDTLRRQKSDAAAKRSLRLLSGANLELQAQDGGQAGEDWQI